MNWTGGQLTRHTGSGGSAAKRRKAHFARARHPARPLASVGAAPREVDTGRPREISTHAGSYRQPKRGAEAPKDAASLDEGRRRLLQSTDWLGLDRRQTFQAPRLPPRSPSQENVKKRPIKKSRPIVPIPRTNSEPDIFCHGALPSEDICVRVGTNALATSSTALSRPRDAGSIVRQRGLSPRVVRAVYDQSSSPAFADAVLPPNKRRKVGRPATSVRPDHAHLDQGSATPASEVPMMVEDEHLYSLPPSLQAHDVPDVHRPETEEMLFGDPGSDAGYSYILNNSPKPINLFASSDSGKYSGAEVEAAAARDTVIPRITRELPAPAPRIAKIQASRALPGTKASAKVREQHSKVHTEVVRPNEPKCITAKTPAPAPAAEVPRPPSDNTLWMRFIFGSDAPELQDEIAPDSIAAAGLDEVDEELSMAAFASSSSSDKGGYVQRTGRRELGIDAMSMLVETGESKTRAVDISSDYGDVPSEMEEEEDSDVESYSDYSGRRNESS